MTAKDLEYMPNCNLVKSIHNKWLQDLATTVAIYMWRLWMSVFEFLSKSLQYHQFFKDGAGDDSLSKTKLKF